MALQGSFDLPKYAQMRCVSSFSVACFLLISGTNLLHAQEQTDVHPYLTNKIFVDLGIYLPDRDTRLGVDGVISGVNEDFDFERATGVKQSDETLAIDFGWQFAKKWSLFASYFKSTGATGAVLTEDIEWKDVVFPAGSNTVIGQEFSVTRVFFGYEFDTSARHEIGIGLGIHQIKFTGFIHGEILTTGGPNVSRAEIVGVEVPLPNIGIWYNYSISPNWVFRSHFEWMDAKLFNAPKNARR